MVPSLASQIFQRSHTLSLAVIQSHRSSSSPKSHPCGNPRALIWNGNLLIFEHEQKVTLQVHAFQLYRVYWDIYGVHWVFREGGAAQGGPEN
jgi:hypothetical protein